MYTQDGHWRQLEAFDCDQIEPPHVGFFRKLPYQLFFTNLDQNIVSTLYIDHMVLVVVVVILVIMYILRIILYLF